MRFPHSAPAFGQRLRRSLAACLLALACLAPSPARADASPPPASPPPADRAAALATMKRATAFMVDKVSYKGGFVWSYLPDFSRRWGELEALPTMIWFQPPGTTTMGNLFLDAYHATGDEFYYRAAERTAEAVVRAQLPCGGWNYVADLAGEKSLRAWYDTVGRNAWRLEEFQHFYGNATFDDSVTAEAATFLLRLYLEKHDPRHRPALDKAIDFVLAAQHPVGAWPQRFPRTDEFSHHGNPDYTSCLTFNDDVTTGNIDFLIRCYQTLGDRRLLGPIARGMDSFLATQGPPAQPAWALQHTADLQPAGARTYEPKAWATHTTARNITQLLRFYRLTGDRKYLARLPEAIDWLDSVRSPAELCRDGRNVPTFLEVGTNQPLYLHRSGSNAINGRYSADHDPHNLIGHYWSFRSIDLADLRQQYQAAATTPPETAVKDSPLRPGAGPVPLPRYFAIDEEDFDSSVDTSAGDNPVAAIIASLNPEGYWPAPLRYTSHPFTHDGSPDPAPGDFVHTRVGDDTDTSPYPDEHPVTGITTSAYIRNMGVLIRHVEHRN